MISKWMAIMFIWTPLIGFGIFRFVMEPRSHLHPTVQEDWWMRGEAYAIFTLGMIYFILTLVILLSHEDNADA